MVAWLLRGLAMTAVHVVARVLLALAIVKWPLEGTYWKVAAIAAVVLIAFCWGGIDGILDARAHPDPDDYNDLLMRWLKAGLFAGVVSSVICWVLGRTTLPGMGEGNLAVDIVAGGSFVALLILLPAMVGAAIGRWLVRRQYRNVGEHHHAQAGDNNATDNGAPDDNAPHNNAGDDPEHASRQQVAHG
ncbi:B-4DMT family transporter [Gordonia jinhuaensis]|nr:B-4DMT family transporter [Gordonia jinhuaensis]